MKILGFPKTFKALNDDALMIKCNKNHPDIAFDCFLINCDIIVLGESSVELGFELTMMKNDPGTSNKVNLYFVYMGSWTTRLFL